MKYKSKYYDILITQNNYIIEILLERQAAKNNTELPLRYCDNEKWLAEFKRQLKSLSVLLRDVTAESIIAALKSDKYKWVYSLGNPKFKSEIKTFYKNYNPRKTNLDASPSGQLSKNSMGDFSLNKQQTKWDILDG